MVLDKEEVDARLASPDNLFNRFRAAIPTLPSGLDKLDENTTHPAMPSVDDLVENLDDKLNTAKSFSKAKQVLANTLERLDARLIEVDKPTDLCKIAEGMGKLLNGFDEHKKGDLSKAPVIIYKPVMNSEVHYGDVINSEI